jgi:hypothetical protein
VQVVFKYSLIEEAKTLYDFVFHYDKIRGLRLVYPSPVTIIKATFNRKKNIADMVNIWETIEPKFTKALEENGLDWDYGPVIGYIHTFRCEGWYNTLKNQIHVRITKSTKRNTAETIVHELLHLIAFNEHASYKEREELVDKYIETPVFKNIIMSVPEK